MSTLDLTKKSRKVACVATLTAAGLSFGLVACGGDSTTSDTAAASPATTTEKPPQGAPPARAPGGAMTLTAKQEKCLTGKGIDLPDTSAGSGPGENGQAPPVRGSIPDPDEMAAAFDACGVDAPEPPSGQPGQSS